MGQVDAGQGGEEQAAAEHSRAPCHEEDAVPRIAGVQRRLGEHGYPRGLSGDEIPELARVLSVADVYDVMTARDSYRRPVGSLEAIQELRRVAGTQLDPHFVEAFVRVLAGRDLRFRHGDDADFDAELALERRAHDYAIGAAEAL
jgi:hypothetical protein